MIQRINLPSHLTGLTDPEIVASREEHGLNIHYQGVKNTWWKIILSILKEPMLIILLLISIIYFLLAQYEEAYFMLGAIIVVSGLSFTRITGVALRWNHCKPSMLPTVM